MDFEQRLKEHRIGIQNILHSLKELEKESTASKEARDVATTAEISRIRTQVEYAHNYRGSRCNSSDPYKILLL